ncbi:MAG: RNA polymerase sigma factor [Fuerstiella sp.]
MDLPDTRNSLLLEVRDLKNRQAWEEFSAIYRPVIFRLAQFKGLQTQDAEDLTQQVLINVARAINGWEPDPDKAKFRTWLRRVADNAILNALTRQRPDKAAGGEVSQSILAEYPTSSDDSKLLQIEYRRAVFALVAKQIRPEFSDETWAAFWKTTVDEIDIDDVAKELGRTRGSVYAARSRVMKRLRSKVEEYDASDHRP